MMKPRVLAEVKLFEHLPLLKLERENSSDENNLGYLNYKNTFLINGFLRLIGTLFFAGNSSYDMDSNIEDRFINFAKSYDETYNL